MNMKKKKAWEERERERETKKKEWEAHSQHGEQNWKTGKEKEKKTHEVQIVKYEIVLQQILSENVIYIYILFSESIWPLWPMSTAMVRWAVQALVMACH